MILQAVFRASPRVCSYHARLLRNVSLGFQNERKVQIVRGISTGPEALTAPMHYLNGRRINGSNQDSADDFAVLEPSTGKTLCTVRSANQQDVNQAVQNAKEAFPAWGEMSGAERSTILNKAAQIIRTNKEEIAVAEVCDSGKPLWEARFDIDGCADTVEYCAALARTIAGQHIDLGHGNFGYTRREPLGVVGGIGAWNFPFQMAAWKSAGALCCGNAVVYKPSPLTPVTTALLGEIYTEAGLPDGVFNVVQGGAETGHHMCSHPDIAKISFTGSVPTGTKVMEACAGDIKYVLLELGGKSPVLIFDDCDVDNAVTGTMMANFLSQGQVCSNGTRVYVQRPLYDTFLDKLVKRVQTITVGDPMKDGTKMGAMISKQQADKVMGYIEEALHQGAKAVTGGERVTPHPDLSGGNYITPCVLTNVKDTMRAAREEIFGPVVCVFPFDTEEEAILRANDTEFGLAGGVFTKDLQKAHRVAASIQSGNIYINNYNVYPSELPFGGYKKSGVGRENSILNIDAFTQVKTVYVEMGDIESLW